MRPCKTKYCTNQARTDRLICGKCNSRKYRANNPYRAAYSALKHNARRRGKEFGLSFEEFKEFAVRVDLLQGAGITRDSYHVDRIDETKGYVVGNLQKLTNSQNIRKYLIFSKGINDKPENYNTKTVKPEKDKNSVGTPF